MADHVIGSAVRSNQYRQVGYEKLVVSTTSVPLASVHADAVAALIVCETAAVRWRGDADPTATDGSPLAANDSILIESRHLLLDIEFIRSGGADATLQVIYFA